MRKQPVVITGDHPHSNTRGYIEVDQNDECEAIDVFGQRMVKVFLIESPTMTDACFAKPSNVKWVNRA